ncbi:MAG: hypothetical protein M3R27_09685 [Bacteroidota bacterium]|nr:hypothetical protein [Bacteroidota bacterium]
MGKRLSLSYSAYISPSYVWPSRSSSEGEPGINYLNSIDLDFVIKPRTSLCFSTQFGRTGLTYATTFYYDNGTMYYKPKDKKAIGLQMLNFTLGFKFFNRGYLAPHGKYKKVELVLLSPTVIFDRDAFYLNNSSESYPVSNKKYTYKSVAIGYTIGRQRIIKDMLIIDTGIRFGITPYSLYNFMFEFSGAYSDGTFQEQFIQPVHERLFGAQLFNIHFGIGFLAF